MKRRSEGVLIGAEVATDVPWPLDDDHKNAAVIEALEPMVTEARAARLQAVFAARTAAVTVVVDSLHDPHNGAAIVRSCDAFGVPVMHAIERHEAFAAARAVAKGSQKWVEIVNHAGAERCVARLRESGHELVATHPEGELEPEDLARVPKVALLLGNERDGIDPTLRAACGRSVRVPMRGFVESLNVSVTAAILLHAATRGRSGDLDPRRLRALYARGLYLTVQRADERLAGLLGA
jgi:tRNA (guanosine-2'-O-)-methyltransferase